VLKKTKELLASAEALLNEIKKWIIENINIKYYQKEFTSEA
jgi:hypothetical protein